MKALKTLFSIALFLTFSIQAQQPATSAKKIDNLIFYFVRNLSINDSVASLKDLSGWLWQKYSNHIIDLS